MSFRREIDHPARAIQGHVFGDEHVPYAYFFPFASFFIHEEIIRKGFLKHQSNAFAHNANCIDRVDDGLSWRVEQIALEKFNHLEIPTWFKNGLKR